MDTVPTPPESTKTSLRQRLRARANDRWPQLSDLTIRHRGGFAYIDGPLPDGTALPLFRLRYGGSAKSWALRSTSPAAATAKTPSYPTETTKKPSTVPAAATSTTTPPGPNPRQLTDVTISSYPAGTSISTGADLGEHRLGPVTVARLPLPRP